MNTRDFTFSVINLCWQVGAPQKEWRMMMRRSWTRRIDITESVAILAWVKFCFRSPGFPARPDHFKIFVSVVARNIRITEQQQPPIDRVLYFYKPAVFILEFQPQICYIFSGGIYCPPPLKKEYIKSWKPRFSESTLTIRRRSSKIHLT